jgi:beta-galactosidase
MKKLFKLFLLVSLSINTQAQSTKFNTILYGAAYYQEYMPYDRLDKDIEMMKEAGISVVRIGESTWSLYEPQEGKFEFGWLIRILDKMHAAGIKVILGTPTYSIPAWMAKKYPEILVEKADGTKMGYGIRQNFDITNPDYVRLSERVIRKMMEGCAKHPAIIGFQVDNEIHNYGANNKSYFDNFVKFIKDKYKTTDNLNKSWGLNYWGMTINDWNDLPARRNSTNPSYKLQWDLFGQKAEADVLNWQARIVKEYQRPDQFITHCFMPWISSVDQVRGTQEMEFPALNVYHGTQKEVKGEDVMWPDDFFRSLKRRNHIVTETNAQTISWDSRQYPPFDGQPRLFTYSHLAGGANMVEYWHWHSIHWGQETYWKGVLSHDLEPNRFYKEVSVIGNELKKIGPKLVNLNIKNAVAILYSRESEFSIGYMPLKDGNTYMEILKQMQKAAFRLNIGTDFVMAENADFTGYKVLMVPPLYVATDSLLKKISDYVKNGGHVIMAFKSGFCNENSEVRHVKAPGPLREAAGFYYQEFSTINTLGLKDNPFQVSEDANKVYNWAEYLIPETAKVLAYYADPNFSKYPAITENKFGKGSLTYEGCILSDEIQSKLLQNKALELGITTNDHLTYPIVTKHGVNEAGKTIRYFLNYSGDEKIFNYTHKGGTDLLTNTTIKKGDSVKLLPWGVVIVEE